MGGRRIGCPHAAEFYSINSILELGDPILFLLCIWRSCASPKVSFFAWEASRGKTLNYLVKQRVYSLAKRCFLCQKKKKRLIIFCFIVNKGPLPLINILDQ